VSRQEAIALPEIRMLPYSVQPEDSCGESPGCTGGFSKKESHSIYDRVLKGTFIAVQERVPIERIEFPQESAPATCANL